MCSSIRETSSGRAALAFVLLLVGGTAFAQTAAPPAGQPAPAKKEEAQPPTPEAGEATQAPVEPVPEAIEITEGTGFRYDSHGRRDPFVSLALGVNVLPPDVRPPGLAGMLIQEVSLRGIVKTVDGYIAMIQGTDNKSYFARQGERLKERKAKLEQQRRAQKCR